MAVRNLRVIDPADEASEMGPMVSAGQRDAVQKYLDQVSPSIVGSAPQSDGYWLAPVVVESASTTEPVWREEVFGPLVAVMPFDSEDEAIALANDTEYGLSDRSSPTISVADCAWPKAWSRGNLSVNSSVRYWTPFGGFKQSGLGRELGPDAPNAFTEEKNVFINTERN